jgi:KaiC/GvpD/RAD55 family RecA-like ATPase
MVDRLTGKPLHLDISDLPMKRGITTNRNKFVLGPSGSGKSFFMNHLVRQYYEQGARMWYWWTRETPIRACAA